MAKSTPRTTRRVGPNAKQRAAELRAFNEAEALRAAEVAAQEAEPVAEIPDPTVAKPEFDEPITGPIEVNEGELATLAHEINSRLTIADTYERKTIDHQLAIAIQLARVKAICTERKINFRKWAETNLPPERGWQMIRKLARIGESPNPNEALEEYRQGTRARRNESYQRLRDARTNQRSISAPPANDTVAAGFTVEQEEKVTAPAATRYDRYSVVDDVMGKVRELEEDDRRFVIEATLRSVEKITAKAAIEKVFGEGSLAA